MKKFIAAIAMCGTAISTSMVPAPAFAQEAIQALFVDPNPELSALCVLKPSEQSGFVAVAINVVTTPGGPPVTVDTPGGVVTYTGNGTGVPSTKITGPAHVHGQSPNIFGFITKTLYYATSTKHIPTTTTTPGSTTTFDCHVHKPTNGTVQDDDPLHPGYHIAPPGLQADPVTIHSDPVITHGERTELAGPLTVTLADHEDGVICISPGTSKGSLGGTWRTQNGYVNGSLGGTCSTTWYYQLQAINPIPSESLPPA